MIFATPAVLFKRVSGPTYTSALVYPFDSDTVNKGTLGSAYDLSLINSASLSSAYPKFGPQGLNANGVTAPVAALIGKRLPVLRDAYWSLEGWVYIDRASWGSFTNILFVIGNSGTGTNFRLFASAGLNGRLAITTDSGGSNTIIGSAAVLLPLRTLQHVAMCRDASGFRVYLNGALSINTAYNPPAYDGSEANAHFGVGGFSWSVPGNGSNNTAYIDHVRLVYGASAYSGSSFTPPNTPPL